MLKTSRSRSIGFIGLGLLTACGLGGYFWSIRDDGGMGAVKARAKRLGLPERPNDVFNPPDSTNNALPGLELAGRRLSEWRKPDGSGLFVNLGMPANADLIAVAPILDELTVASRKSAMAFGIDYDEPYVFRDESRNLLTGAVKALCSDGRRLAKEGRLDSAFDRLEAAARIVGLYETSEPSIMAVMIRVNMETMTIDALLHAITALDATEATLNRAERVLRSLGPEPSAARYLRAEYAFALAWAEPKEYDHSGFAGSSMDSWHPDTLRYRVESWLKREYFNSRSNPKRAVAAYLDHHIDAFEAVGGDPTDYAAARRRMEALEAKVVGLPGWQTEIAQQQGLPSSDFVVTVAASVARRRTANALIAALRTQSDPTVRLGLVALDPFTNQPLAYRRDHDATLVYSVGRDRIDDGGDPSEGLDVVACHPYPRDARLD